MPSLRFRDATRYGATLVGSLLVAVVVGGAALAVGVALALPELDPLLGAGAVRRGRLAGGVVLASLGVVVLGVGLASATYKLVADAVAVGVARGATPSQAATDAAGSREAGAAGDDGGTPAAAGTVPSVEPDVGGSTADDAGADAVPTAQRSDDAVDWTSGTDAGGADARTRTDAASGADAGGDRPEPSAAEIAFGPEADQSGAGVEPAEPGDSGVSEEDAEEREVPDDETTGSESVEPAGRNAPSDPLGSRGEDG